MKGRELLEISFNNAFLMMKNFYLFIYFYVETEILFLGK